MSLKLAMNHATLMQCQTEEFIEVSARAGFKAVELRMDKLKESLFHLSYTELSRCIHRYGMTVVAVNALEGATFVPEDNLDVLKKACEMVGRACEMVESPWVISPSAIWFASVGPFPSTERIKTVCAERISFIADILKPYGVQLAFEPVGLPDFIVKDLEMSQDIIDLSGDDSVGLAPDVHNLFCNGSKAESLSKVKSPVRVIHLNDTENLPLDKQHVVETRAFPGEGIAGAQEWVKTAVASGYKGYFSLELFRQDIWDMLPQEAASLCYRKMEKYAEPFGGIA